MRWIATAVVTAMLTQSAMAADHLKLAIGSKGLGESEVCETGMKAGIFQKHGLDLECFYTGGTAETQQAVISGSAQIGVALGILGVIGAYAKGAPMRIIGASFTGDSNLFWYVRADSPIKTARDAIGRTVAYSTNGSSAHNVVLQMQKELGAQFKLVATGSGSATLPQVLSGQVDVGWSGAPFAVDRLEDGQIRAIWNASDIPALRGMTSRVLVTHADFIAAKPDVVQRFVDAYRETNDWLYGTDAGLRAYADWAEITPAVARRTFTEFMPKSAVDPDKVLGLDRAMASAVEFKYIPAPLTDTQVKDLVRIPPRKSGG
jgi:NitT/TauT family transport system substrate-binding protein